MSLSALGICSRPQQCISDGSPVVFAPAGLCRKLANPETYLEYNMRIANSALAFTSLLLMAWSLACGATPTPRPIYTPYPSFTVEASSSARFPAEAAAQSADLGEVVELKGQKDWFYGDALSYARDGISEFRKGNYQAAIDNFERARRHRDKPSAVLENWMGLSYQGLERYEEAIRHHSASIQIEDSTTDRTNRGIAYLLQGRCAPAVAGAKAALAACPRNRGGLQFWV